MALITCSECGQQISNKATACIGCGCPVESMGNFTTDEELTMDFSYTDIDKSTLTLNDGIAKYYHKNKLLGKFSIHEMTILYFCKKNSFGVGQLYFIVPNAKRTLALTAKNEDCVKLDKIYNAILPYCIYNPQKSISAAVNYQTEEMKTRIIENKEKQHQNAENFRNACATVQNAFGSSKTAKCPKCRSTSISYTNKKLSLGRTLVGGVVAGGAGAVIGGLSSKKGYAVCLNCGKQWKI